MSGKNVTGKAFTGAREGCPTKAAGAQCFYGSPLVRVAFHWDTWNLCEEPPKDFLETQKRFFPKVTVKCPGCTDRSPGGGQPQRWRQAGGQRGTTESAKHRKGEHPRGLRGCSLAPPPVRPAAACPLPLGPRMNKPGAVSGARPLVQTRKRSGSGAVRGVSVSPRTSAEAAHPPTRPT